MRLNKLLIFLGFTLLNITSGCTSNAVAVGIDCSKNVTSDLSMPDFVMVGRDVVDI
jgi:hypothetical protein